MKDWDNVKFVEWEGRGRHHTPLATPINSSSSSSSDIQSYSDEASSEDKQPRSPRVLDTELTTTTGSQSITVVSSDEDSDPIMVRWRGHGGVKKAKSGLRSVIGQDGAETSTLADT